MDVTSLKVSWRGHSLYRAIDSDGNLVDVNFGARSGMTMGEAFNPLPSQW